MACFRSTSTTATIDVSVKAGRAQDRCPRRSRPRRIEKPFTLSAHTYWRACIAALLGEKQQAVDLLRESFAQGRSHSVGLHRDMDLEALREDPPFQELLRPKG